MTERVLFEEEGNVRKVIFKNPLRKNIIVVFVISYLLTLVAFFVKVYVLNKEISTLGNFPALIIITLMFIFVFYFLYTPKLILLRDPVGLAITQTDFMGIKRKLSIQHSQNPILFAKKKPLVVKRGVVYRPFIKFKNNNEDEYALLIPHRPFLFFIDSLKFIGDVYDFTQEELEKIAKFLKLKIEIGDLGYYKIAGVRDKYR